MRYFLVVLIIVLFGGCNSSSPNPKPIQKKINKQEIEKNNTQRKQKVLPKWIKNPDYNGNIGGVGVIKVIKNKKKQKYIAKRLAIANLLERKKVIVQDEFESKRSNDSLKNIHSTHQSTSGTMTDEYIVKDEYCDGENYYIWVVIKK